MSEQTNPSGDLGSWLDVVGQALKTPAFDEQGKLIFEGSPPPEDAPPPAKSPPLPKLPGGEGVCDPAPIRILPILDLADIIRALETMATNLNKLVVAHWLDLVCQALEHPEFDQGGMLVFRTSNVRKQPPLPILPGGDDKQCRSVDHIFVNVGELAEIIRRLREMV